MQPKGPVLRGEKMARKRPTCSFRSGFPTVATILLVLGILWLLNDLKVLTIDIPWWPVILIVIAIGWIVNFYSKKK